MDDRLSRLISDHNLDAYRVQFAQEGIDLPAMAAMIDADLDRFADLGKLPLGARARLRALRDQARKTSAMASGTLPGTAELSDADRQLVELLPTPLARAANEVLKPVGDRTNLDVQSAVDVLLRSLALVCQSDYFHSNDWYDPEINEMFPSLEQRPSHGTWRRFINLCLASAKRSRHACFLRELPDTWYRCENKQPLKHESEVFDEFNQPVRRGGGIGMLELLVHHRNALAHSRKDSRDLGLAAQFRQVCLDVFREYRWLGRYELWMGSASQAYLLQGVSPREAFAGPTLLSGDRDVVLRRLRGNNPKEWEVLPMPPLILSAAAVPGEPRQSGTSDSEVIIYSALVSRKDGGDPRINYTSDPFAPRYVSIETAHGANELRRLQDKKSFPRVSRDALEREDLKRRIRAASERTFRVLDSSGKFRRRLHVERAAYEPRLAPWIDSTVPLLGLAAEAGAGKTGILASLASRWVEQSAAPVLFVLANQHQTVRDLDRLVQDALTLGRDVTVSDICAHCRGLVIVIDGLNEHPGREDLVLRICSLAQSSLETVNGARFAVTWRTEDDAWIREASGRRLLWWAPEDVGARIDADREDPMLEPAKVPYGPEPEHEGGSETPSSDPAPPNEGLAEGPDRPFQRKATGEDATFVRIGPLTDDECAEAWRRYRTDVNLRLRPEFDWEDVRQQSPGLARRLRNPLWMRVLMECMHEKELPPDLGETDVFSEYLEQIRSDYSACRADQLLEALGRIMLRRRDLRITLDDLERECWDLVHPREGQSPLLALERRGMLSSIDGRSFTFAVERLAEQVIGEHVAGLPAAESGTALAMLASDLHRHKFSQAHGVVQEALHQCLKALDQGAADAFLFQFIDACPDELVEVAAAALERRIVELGEASAPSVVEMLLEDRTDSDLTVATSTARRLSERGLHHLAVAFLTPFITTSRVETLIDSIRYLELLQQFIGCVSDCLAVDDDDCPAWLDRERLGIAIDALRDHDQRLPSEASARLLAMALMALAYSRPGAAIVEDPHAALGEAVDTCRRRIELATRAGDPKTIDDARRQLAVYLERLADHHTSSEDPALRERSLVEALRIGKLIRDADAWSPCPALWELGFLAERAGQLERAVTYSQQCLAVEKQRRLWWNACHTAFRIGELLEKLNDDAGAKQAELQAVEFAKASGSRRDYAVALEWSGDAHWRRGKHEEAMDAYQRSLQIGSHPMPAEGWNANSVLAEIAKVHSERGEHSEALAIRRKIVDSLRDSGERRALTIALEYLGHALRDAGLHRDAIEEYLESHEIGSTPEPVERWRPTIPLHWAARCHHALGEFDRTIEIRRSLVHMAKDAEDRRRLVVELDWLACELRDAKRLDEAALAFGEAYEVGMHPQPLQDWSPSGLLLRHAHMEVSQGRLDGALRLQRHAVDLSRSSGDRARLSEDLDRLGDVLRGAGRVEEALQAYLDAVHTGMSPERAPGWSPAVPLSGAAQVFTDLGRWEEAIEYRRRAAQAFADDGNRRGQAVELEHLGHALQKAGRLEEALDAYRKSHEAGMTPERVGDWKPGFSLSGAAAVLFSMERWEEAVECRRQAAQAFADDGDRGGQAVQLDLLGDALRRAGRSEDALQAYRDAVHTGMTPERAADWKPGFPLWGAARVFADMERWDEAAEFRRQAAQAFADDGNRGGQAVQLEYLGHALQMAGRLEEALNAYRKSHEAGMTPERVGDWKPGFSLSGAAAVLFSMERWEEAVECRRQAAQAFADDGDRGGQAVQLDLLGDALRRAGRSEDALQAYMDAVHTGMTPERAPDWSPAAPLSDAALVLAELERWDEAAEFRRQAAQAFADDGNRGGQAVELELLGHALRVVGRLDDALDAYLKSHEAGMTPERVPDWKPGDSLTNAAGVLDALERWDEAIAYRRRAVEMYAADGDRREQALELEFLGDSLVELDRLGDALDCYRQSHSVGMLPEPVANWDPARSLMEAARVLTQQGRLGPANDMFAEAVKQALALRNRTDDGSHAPTLLLTTTEWGRMLADHEGRIAALEAMEPGRAAALSIEGHGDAARWKLEHCVDWWSLQSELLSAIGDRAEAEDASRRADALRARIAAMEEE